MSHRQDVTIIVPCHNYGQWLGQALESLATQTRPPGRIIVVDDGSVDETMTVASAFAADVDHGIQVTLIRHDHNRGFIAALETGLAACSSAYVAHIDADDRVSPRYVEALAAALDADPAVGYAYPWMRLFGEEEGLFLSGPFDIARLLYDGSYIPHIAMFRSAAFRETTGYRRLPTHIDWDLWLSFADAGWPGTLVDEVLYEWRRHGDSMTHRPTTQRLATRLDVLWHHRRLLARHLPGGLLWFSRSVVRRARVRLPGCQKLPYGRTASCWVLHEQPKAGPARPNPS